MKTVIHQLVHTLSYGDAISGEVLALRRVFHEFGWESEIYSINTHPHYQGLTRDYRDFPGDFSGKVILHLSLGSPLSALYLRLEQAERVMIYHNLTPPEWFAGVNPRIVRDITQGLKELPDICRVSDLVIADSAFNAGELERFDVHAKVLALPVDPARWSEPANSGIQALLAGEPVLHLLHVGRLAPNKCIEDIIKVFYFLRHHVAPQAKLWLVGIDIDTEVYSFSLKRLARELEVDDAVQFVGSLSDSEVRALYQGASVYICMSEHEGFCVPLIEAMHFGLPVIAFDSSAVADTVGTGGIIIQQKRHAEIAELVAKVAEPGELRQRMKQAGKERVAQLSYENFKVAAKDLFSVGVKSQRVVGQR
jgi:L-malate glycosyltransferase